MQIKLNSTESKELLTTGQIIIERNGNDIVIEKNEDYDGGYSIDIINYYDEVVLDTKVTE